MPIFPDQHANAETVPALAHAACSEDLSIQSLCSVTGASESQYSQVREEIMWASLVMSSLNPIQKSNVYCRRVIRYGDDCSGARGPLEALRQFATKLSGVHLVDAFASECPGSNGDGPRAFIDAQCNPAIMFETAHRGTGEHGKNFRTGEPVLIPTGLTIYTAGWVCVDVSTMNRHRRPLLPGSHRKVVAGKAGASSQTLDSSLTYIRVYRPEICLLYTSDAADE